MNDIHHLRNELAKYQQRVIELEQSEARLKMAANSIQLGTWEYNPISGN
jgi:hypothetical protein